MSSYVDKNNTDLIRVQPLCAFGLKTYMVIGEPIYVFEFLDDGSLEIPIEHTTYKFVPAGVTASSDSPYMTPPFCRKAVGRKIGSDSLLDVQFSDFALIGAGYGKLYLRELTGNFRVFTWGEPIKYHPQDRINVIGEIDALRIEGGVWRATPYATEERFQEWKRLPRCYRKQSDPIEDTKLVEESAPYEVMYSSGGTLPRVLYRNGEAYRDPMDLPMRVYHGPICPKKTNEH